MKAIRAHSFGGPEVLQLDKVDDPVAGEDEVVIDVRAVGINPADTYMRTGTYAIVPELPYIPGGDAAGVVSAIGSRVDRHLVGDHVFVGTATSMDMTGCYAEKVKRKASEVLPLPNGVSFTEAATKRANRARVSALRSRAMARKIESAARTSGSLRAPASKSA